MFGLDKIVKPLCNSIMGNAITNPARLIEKKVFGVEDRNKSLFVDHSLSQPTGAPAAAPQININIIKEYEKKLHQMEVARMERENKIQQERYERQQKEQQLRFDTELKQQKLETTRRLKEQQQQQNIKLRQAKTSSLNTRKNELFSEKQRIISKELSPVQTEISTLNQQICVEEKAVSKFSVEQNDSSIKIITLVGNTGDGKSVLGNRLCGDTSMMADSGPYTTSDGNASCTQRLQKSKYNKLSIVDCPGWNDGDGNDRGHTNNLCEFMRGSKGINAFIVVRNATNCRFDANFKDKLRYLGYVFGDVFWTHLIVVLTHVDKGIVATQFANSNKTKEMQDDVSKLCNGLNKTVAVIPIGLDNYDGKLKMIVDTIPQNRFICTHIKSPIDDLRSKRSVLMQKQSTIQQRINAIINKINNIDTQINSL